MNALVPPTQPGDSVVELASLLAALRDTRALMPPLDLETDAQAEAVAVLWGLAAGGAGERAAAALWRLGVAPGAPVPCDPGVALRAMVIRLGGTPSNGPIPDCGVSEHELRTECSRFRLPEYCTLCERNPANR